MDGTAYQFGNIVFGEEQVEFETSLNGERFECVLTAYALSEAAAVGHIISREEVFGWSSPLILRTRDTP